MMFTLYDLLDADPKADKERLKEAFRKAAKASHPDVCPDEADAPWRFRQIVRAHEILSDDELRAAYDHVVAFERRMQEAAPPPILNSILAKIVSGVVTAAVVATALFGGYALSAYLADAPVAVASTSQGQTTGRGQSDVTIGPVLAALREVTAEATVAPRPNEMARQTAPEAAKEIDNEIDKEAATETAMPDAAAALEPVPDRARRDARFFARGACSPTASAISSARSPTSMRRSGSIRALNRPIAIAPPRFPLPVGSSALPLILRRPAASRARIRQSGIAPVQPVRRQRKMHCGVRSGRPTRPIRSCWPGKLTRCRGPRAGRALDPVMVPAAFGQEASPYAASADARRTKSLSLIRQRG